MTAGARPAVRAGAAVAVLATAALVFSGGGSALAAQSPTAPAAGRQAAETVRGSGALVGGTLVDGRGGPPLAGAVVTFRDGIVDCVGTAAECPVGELPVLDASGMWITPGLIDGHVHYSQTGWADGGPDQVGDLRDRYPYPRVVAENRADPDRYLRAYLCAGVTATWDVGGYPWTWDLARRVENDPDAPHVVAAGPLLSARDHWLNVPAERQFLYMADGPTVEEAARYLVLSGASHVKVWYLVSESAPDAAHYQEMIRVAAGVAREAGVPLIVHATGLWQAKDALRAGAAHLVHSVSDLDVDEEFLRLAREGSVSYNPTLTVFQGIQSFAERRFDEEAIDARCLDPGTLAKARSTAELPAMQDTARVARRRAMGRERYQVMVRNLLRVHEAGIPVVTGTDAGNTLTLHGPAIFAEMEAMQAAGLSPMDVIVATTANPARAMGRTDLGVVEPGRAADLVVLADDPTRDVAAFRSRRWVVRGGWLHDVEALRYR